MSTVLSIDDSLGTPPLGEAIDRHPLIVTPNSRLADVIGFRYQSSFGKFERSRSSFACATVSSQS
jgi:hypothetical protein